MIIADLTLNRLNEARRRIEGMVHRTPLLHSQTLSARIGAPVWLKCENLQKTGAFKVRGALNRLLTLSDEERARGVSTVSAGNHAQAVAWAATSADVSSTVVMMEHASPTKVRASQEYGAEVILHGDASAAFHKVQEVSDERGLTFVPPFAAADVVAGHASCGLEILEDLPETGTIVVPVGGGGLSSSIAAAAALSGTEVDVWGVEPTGAPAMHASFSAGQAVQIDQVNTVADGLGPPMAGAINYEILSQHARGIVLVEDSEIVSAMMVLLERTKLLAEPSGAAGLAALLQGKIEIDQERPVVIVISGGNADLDQLARLVQGEAC